MAPSPSPTAPSIPSGLLERLRADAGPRGFLPFDRVVDRALYDPETGYYESAEPPLGPHGDFYTAAHASPLFGGAVAARAFEEFERLGRPARFRIVELGPGDGTLARDLLAALVPRMPPTTTVDYVLVERSRRLARASAEALLGVADPGRVAIRRADALSTDGPFSGFVIANELLDAVPFRRLVARDGAWRELGLRVGPAAVEWAEGPLGALPPPALPAPPRDGIVLEVAPAAEAILREVADHLVAGAAVFVDYGLEEPELLLGHPEGTFAAVRAHRPVDDPLAELGRADLSAFVNFTRLRDAARRAGLTERAYVGQAEALVRWGLPALLEERARASVSSEAEVRVRLAAKNLLFGFGTFRVLDLAPPGSAVATPDATPSPAAP